MKCLIVSGGQFSKAKIDRHYDLVIACDKGYMYAKKLGIKVDIVVGDFDSMKRPKDNVVIIEAEKEKDDTDTGLAVKYAIRSGYKNIDIICALGKRLDHTLANISLLKYIAENGAKGKIISGREELFTIGQGVTKIKKKPRHYLSIFSLSDRSLVEYIKGTKYNVQNITLRNSFSLGISNKFEEEFTRIKVKKGILLVSIIKE